MMKAHFLSATFVALVFFLGSVSAVHAAHLLIDPEEGRVKPGEQVSVKLRIISPDRAATTIDALWVYDSTNLKVVEIREPAEGERCFPKFFKRVIKDKIYMGAAIAPGGTAQTCPNNVIGEVVFEGIKTSNNIVSFLCTDGKTTDSNISLKVDGAVTDVIDCSQVNDGQYIVAQTDDEVPPTSTPRPTQGDDGPTATPDPDATLTPTGSVTGSPTGGATIAPTAVPTAVPTPSQLPESGVIDTMVITVSMGLLLTVASFMIRAVI